MEGGTFVCFNIGTAICGERGINGSALGLTGDESLS